MSVPYPEFANSDLFNRHFDKNKIFTLDEIETEHKKRLSCQHDFSETDTFDGNGNERVCLRCGEVAPTEITEFDKLSGCMDGEDFMKVRYGPSTPAPLQSFLLPTMITKKERQIFRMKLRDRFVDNEHLLKTRKYTDIQRLCQQHYIPNDYAVEVMRRMLHSTKNIHSRYKPVEILISLIQEHPQLSTRIPALKKETREGQRIERLLVEIKGLKKDLKKERKKNKHLNKAVSII